ncbi:serine O-acetyltransferase [Motilibacter rhizosphaerae]|uniref:Serine O-acetyltransferase n=1 Tax=Motilibacter rhizosphaerae TaxID=598652 RepID=A0A4Q7NQ06_9ACTN|nr:serine acetyltransferase [Motilibacter rhizosphaerae]RZS87369.1 serine O-acetyltransferase [Motilibacter rhizosphaerae]
MITSKHELELYLAEDLRANGIHGSWNWRHAVSPTSQARILRWQRSLRRLEYLTTQPPTPLQRIRLAVLWRLHLRQAAVLGFTIPLGTFGPGLSIAHYGTITVNTRARIGANCRIHPSTTIGATHEGVPTIGDDAYIGPGARITGDVRLGDRVTVAGNAVVTKSFEESGVIIGGVPAKVLRSGVAYEWRH